MILIPEYSNTQNNTRTQLDKVESLRAKARKKILENFFKHSALPCPALPCPALPCPALPWSLLFSAFLCCCCVKHNKTGRKQKCLSSPNKKRRRSKFLVAKCAITSIIQVKYVGSGACLKAQSVDALTKTNLQN